MPKVRRKVREVGAHKKSSASPSRKAQTGSPDARSEEDRRRTILRAAIEVFAKKGYHGCRIADVAKEANVAYGLVYHYFRDKDELLSSVFESGWSGFVDRIAATVQAEAPIEEKVRRLADVAFDAFRSDPQTVRVLILEIARSPSLGRANRDTAFIQVIHLVRGMFAQAKQKGELRSDADPLLCAALLFGQLEMALTAFAVGIVPSPEKEALDQAPAQVSEWFLRGVLPQ